MWTRVRGAIWLLVVVACNSQPEPAPTRAESAAPSGSAELCPGRRSADPEHSLMAPAEAAFEGKRYVDAQRRYEELGRRFPGSATVRMRLGDAYLYEHQQASQKAEYEAAADRAIVAYGRAAELQDRGCTVPERERYYLLLGVAYAHLRKRDAAAALVPLKAAREQWPGSAEVLYHMARASCLQGEVGRCADEFALTLDLARALSRPKFLRTYHSADDWIRRSQTQSEFGPLRKSARYAQILRAARSATPR
jgi:hypothetical protein